MAIDSLDTDPCEHRYEARGHDPGVRLRHLSQIRHATCTSPVCRRPAGQCDFEHNTPFEAGGRTCLCNGGPKCRMTTGSSSSPGGRSTSSPTGRSGGRPRPGAATTPNPPGTPSSRQRDSQQRLAGLRFVHHAVGRRRGGRAWRWDSRAEGRRRSELRASHADRERVIEVLKEAFVQGRLAKDEFDLRVGHAFAARTYAELAAVTRLPASRPQQSRPRIPAPRPSRQLCGLAGGSRWRPRFARACGCSGFSCPGPGIRGRPPARSRVAGLCDHLHLPVRSGHDPVARRGGDG